MTHEYSVRVFYEDTDMAGIVYYANYLKFCERARSTMVREQGISQRQMKDDGLVFVVIRVEADYLGSARLDDELIITTHVQQISPVRLMFCQTVTCDGAKIFYADISVACASTSGRPARMPKDIREKLLAFGAE